MIDYSVTEMTKILFNLMSIGVQISDDDILLISSQLYDSTDSNYETNKKNFLDNIHRLLGK